MGRSDEVFFRRVELLLSGLLLCVLITFLEILVADKRAERQLIVSKSNLRSTGDPVGWSLELFLTEDELREREARLRFWSGKAQQGESH